MQIYSNNMAAVLMSAVYVLHNVYNDVLYYSSESTSPLRQRASFTDRNRPSPIKFTVLFTPLTGTMMK